MEDYPKQNNNNQIAEQILIDTAKIGSYAGGIFIANASQQPRNIDDFNSRIPNNYQPDKPLGFSKSLGTPIYSDLDIQGGSYTDTDGNPITFPAIRFETVLFIVSQSKQIVTTNIQGRNGSIKEYISDDDYAITINGIITGQNNVYPRDSVLSLKKVLDAPVALQINSWFLRQFGIFSIVINDYNFPQVAGRNSQQEFSISALSDLPVILQIR